MTCCSAEFRTPPTTFYMNCCRTHARMTTNSGPGTIINQSINHLFVKASKTTVTKVSVQDQQGSESAYSDPKTKPKYVEKYTKYKQ